MWKLKIAEGSNDRWLCSVNDHIGRQHWEYDENAGTAEERAQVETARHRFKMNRYRTPQSSDLLMRIQLTKENPRVRIPAAVKVKDSNDVSEEAVSTTLRRAIGFYSTIQAHDGHWPAESAGTSCFLPFILMALYITGDLDTILTHQHRKEILRYIYNHQKEDGGWGFHIESHSTMFGSVLNYISLRLLGEGVNDGEDMAMARGRRWILDHGGAVRIPSWGKFWATVLGVYEWEGCNPLPPEFWLVPKFIPINLGRMLSYARLVYMPMSYLYGKRFIGPITKVVQELRHELYTEPYENINWNSTRNKCAKEDLYHPHPLVQDLLWGFLHHFAEPILVRWPFSMLRKKAIKVVMKHIEYEDENSRYLCIGVVEKAFCMLACWVEDPNSDAYRLHLARVIDYFWLAEDGLKCQTGGSQSWDASLSIQAIISSNLSQDYGPTLHKAHDFIKASQVQQNPSGDFKGMYRHISKGSWPFSTHDQGWQVSDCTAEGLKAALLLSQMSSNLVGDRIENERSYNAVNIILSLQSINGGYPAWEPERANRWLEVFNPTEVFGDALLEKGYVECTSSAIQALALFRKLHPGHRRQEIDSCIQKGIHYIEATQNSDGSWYGFWGICFTYATWFGIKALAVCGRNYQNCLTVRKACEFLQSKQLPDGGWGESYLSCSNEVYTNHEDNRSNLVQTSWALLSLIDAGQAKIDPGPVECGLKLLINSQMEDGDFPQQDMTGIYMKTCTLNYSSYRNIFPIWALGEYRTQILMA